MSGPTDYFGTEPRDGCPDTINLIALVDRPWF
jgi:hypothetical protein